MSALDQDEIDGVLLHIKGLIFARALLEQRGASESELAEHAAELQRERRRLAELVRDACRPPISISRSIQRLRSGLTVSTKTQEVFATTFI